MSTSLQRRRANHHHHGALSPANSIETDDSNKELFIPSGSSSPSNGSLSYSPRNHRRRKRARKNCCYLKVMILLALAAAIASFAPFQQLVSWKVLLSTPTIITLPIPNVDIAVPNATEWPLIHIVNTRFMQEQGPLTTLGMARFHLFLTFCFPTMINQSSQNFFWIIKTDPQFATTQIFERLVEAVQDYPNIYLVASNENYLVQPEKGGSWRDGAEGMDLLTSKIYTGNITELHQAIALRNERPVLETRLDADDGLHIYYIQYIQMVALQRFQPEEEENDGDDDGGDNAPRWLYWCTRRHLEWHSSLNQTTTTETETSPDLAMSKGILNPIQHSRLCVTPGITVGFNVGVDAKDVPVHSHDLLYLRLVNSTDCYPKKPADESAASCLDLVEDLLFCALRSRTWTSAGMRNVPLDPVYLPKPTLMRKLWKHLEERFAINQTMAEETQAFLIQHRRQIAYENLLGQCTTGHSCKDQAKQELNQYIQQDKDGHVELEKQ